MDGRENEAYDKFIPTAASAALLERFYGLGDRQGSEVKSLLDAVELYNDWTFRREADALKEKRDTTLKPERGTEEYKKLTREYEAAVKNIRNKLLRP
jgi:hypothetical protein